MKRSHSKFKNDLQHADNLIDCIEFSVYNIRAHLVIRIQMIKTYLLKTLFLIVCLVCYSPQALAKFEDALAAYKAKDYQKALIEASQAVKDGDARANFLLGLMYEAGLGVTASPSEAFIWYQKAAQGGVSGAFTKLALSYIRGTGVPQNTERALAFARYSTQLDDSEGMFLLYTILKTTALNYLDANGKANNTKYTELSSRPLSMRSLDAEAQDALYRSADKNYPLATLTLALAFGGLIGDNNRQRMLALISKIPQGMPKELQSYEKIARHINSLGQSFASPQLFLDAQASQMLAAMLQTCGLQENKDAVKLAPPQLVSITIAKPLSNAQYLSSKVPGYEHAYLIAGTWEENWTYKACDRTATVNIKFIADGLGGARFYSEQSGKDIPGLGDNNKP